MKSKKSSKWGSILRGLRKSAIACGVFIALAGGTHFAAKAYVRLINAGIAAQNRASARVITVAKKVPIELRYGRLRRGQNPVFNPNAPGMCSAYATRVAEKLFGWRYVKAPAWDLPAKNRVVYRAGAYSATKRVAFSKKKFRELLREGKITKGTIIGVFFTKSRHNRADRPFTHTMVYVGMQGNKHIFWHNFGGPKAISLDEIYSAVDKQGNRIFYPVMVINPKEQR